LGFDASLQWRASNDDEWELCQKVAPGTTEWVYALVESQWRFTASKVEIAGPWALPMHKEEGQVLVSALRPPKRSLTSSEFAKLSHSTRVMAAQ